MMVGDAVTGVSDWAGPGGGHLRLSVCSVSAVTVGALITEEFIVITARSVVYMVVYR
jgi:hypothetical protein